MRFLIINCVWVKKWRIIAVKKRQWVISKFTPTAITNFWHRIQWFLSFSEHLLTTPTHTAGSRSFHVCPSLLFICVFWSIFLYLLSIGELSCVMPSTADAASVSSALWRTARSQWTSPTELHLYSIFPEAEQYLNMGSLTDLSKAEAEVGSQLHISLVFILWLHEISLE